MNPNLPAIEKAVYDLLRAIGEDPERDGLRDTPGRVARFWDDFLQPDYGQLDRVFATSYDEMVMLRGVRYYSLCEHHLLPFYGKAAVAYIPDRRGVLGLSKLARIVFKHASRLQLQERLAQDIADEVEHLTKARGVGVSISGVHLCACMRGIKAVDSEFVTNVLRGVMHDEPAARAEFLGSIEV